MRLIVCGGRHYSDRDAAFAALDRAHAKRPITLLIYGGQDGADELGHQWARARGVPHQVQWAEWGKHGRAAGPIRNQVMIDRWKPDGVLALPGNDGTADMVAKARAAGLPVWEPYRSS